MRWNASRFRVVFQGEPVFGPDGSLARLSILPRLQQLSAGRCISCHLLILRTGSAISVQPGPLATVHNVLDRLVAFGFLFLSIGLGLMGFVMAFPLASRFLAQSDRGAASMLRFCGSAVILIGLGLILIAAADLYRRATSRSKETESAA
jgi:hypothetical protein